MISAFKSLANIIAVNAKNFRQSVSMAAVQLNKAYSGSSFGMVWAFVKPVLFVLVYWFGITIGIKGGSYGDVPYIYQLIAGILPWFFISEAWLKCGTSIRRNKHLVTKTVFPISTIPMFEEMYLFFIHLILVGLATVIFAFSGYISVSFIQIIYGMICIFVLIWSISLIFSACVVISRDFEHLIKSLTQVLFWLSPILWNIEKVEKYKVIHFIVRLNPVSYVTEVYRAAFLGSNGNTYSWFFYDIKGTVCFWIEIVVIALLGSYLFKKLEREFADIL